MKVDVDFFERFGSRLDSDQPRCVRGAKWLRGQGWEFPVDFWTVYRECERQRDAGRIDPDDAASWLEWADKLTRNADAIDHFGTAERAGFLLVAGKMRRRFKTLKSARRALKRYADKLRGEPLEVLSAVKLENAPRGGKRTIPVKRWSDLEHGTCYIHNPRTGKQELVSGDVDEIKAKAQEFARDRVERRLARVRIYEVLRDPEDGFEGLREIKQRG